jgi:hypothetical protein
MMAYGREAVHLERVEEPHSECIVSELRYFTRVGPAEGGDFVSRLKLAANDVAAED